MPHSASLVQRRFGDARDVSTCRVETGLPSQGITYAKFGTWRDHFSSTLTLKGLQVFAALDSTIPTEYPEVKEDEDDEDSLELTNVLTLQWKVTNKYEFAAKSAEAYALLYEAATHNVQIQRVIKKHKGKFPGAFAAVSHFAMDNAKPAARAQRKGALEGIRKCSDTDAVRGVITLVTANTTKTSSCSALMTSSKTTALSRRSSWT